MKTETNLTNGTRVSWTEFNGKTCTGKLIRHVGNYRGEDTGYVDISVDSASYHTACHGSHAMHTGRVQRDIKMHNVVAI